MNTTDADAVSGRPVALPAGVRAPTPAGTFAPLSFGQQATLVADGGRGTLNLNVAVPLTPPPPDLDAVLRLLAVFQHRNDGCRALLATKGGRLGLAFHDAAQVPAIDLQTFETVDARSWAVHGYRRWTNAPFGRRSMPLARALLLRRHGAAWLHLAMSPLVCDGWSVASVTKEITEIWRSIVTGCDLPDPPGSLQAYMEKQQRHHGADAVAEYRAFWREELGGGAALALPPTGTEDGFRVQWCPISELEATELRRLRGRFNTTDFCILSSALATALARLASQATVVLYTDVVDRSRAGTFDTIGCLLNYIGVRIEVGRTLEETVASCQAGLGRALRRQHGPFVEITPRAHEGAMVAVNAHGYGEVGDAWNGWGNDCRSPLSPVARMASGELDWSNERCSPVALGDIALGYKPAPWGLAAGLFYSERYLDGAAALGVAEDMHRLLKAPA